MFRFSYFSWIRSVLLDDQACPFFVHVRLRSFRSMHPPPPPPFILTIFVSFMCVFSHICNDCVVFGSICFVSCLHVLCMYWHSLSSFFCSCPAPVFRIYDPPLYILTIPVLFHIILCCFRSNFGSSVLCPVYMYCVLYLAFLHVAIFFLFAVLPGFCLSVLAMYFVLSSTLQTPPFLLNWYQKTKFTSLRQYHFICTVL
jgi:hypothetical protein